MTTSIKLAHGSLTVPEKKSETGSGLYSTISGGHLNLADGYGSTTNGGLANSASGQYAVNGGGLANISSGVASTVVGGQKNTASGNSSTADGYYVISNRFGQYAHSSTTFDDTNTGEAQYTRVTYSGVSVGGALVSLLDGGGNSYAFLDNTSCILKVSIVASEATGANPAAFVLELLVNTVGGTSTIVGGTAAGFTRNTPGYTVAITASTNQININFTGISADVRAVATIEATELTFA